MTTEANRVRGGNSLKSPLFQPECVLIQIFRWLCNVLVWRVTLRLIGLMADLATRVSRRRLLLGQRRSNEPNTRARLVQWVDLRDDLNMNFMRKIDTEIRDEIISLLRSKKALTQTWKRVSSRVTRRDGDVAIRAYGRSRAVKKLLAMTVETGRMLWVLGYIGKGSICLTNIFPVRRGKLMAGVTGQLLSGYVIDVGESRVIDTRRLFRRCRSRPTLLLTSS